MKRTLALLFLVAAQLALLASPTMPWLKNARGPSGAGAPGAPTPDILWWKLNAGTGTTALTPEVGGAFSHDADWVTGKSGSGYALDFTAANSDNAQSDASVTYGSATALTVTFWAYFDNNSTAAMVVESGPSATTWGGTFWIYLDGSGNLNVCISGATGYNTRYVAAPSTGAWVHIAATYNYTNGAVQLYYDGVLQSLTNDTSTFSGPHYAENWAINLGARNGGASLFIDGRIDDFRIYGSILSNDDINAVKNDPQ